MNLDTFNAEKAKELASSKEIQIDDILKDIYQAAENLQNCITTFKPINAFIRKGLEERGFKVFYEVKKTSEYLIKVNAIIFW